MLALMDRATTRWHIPNVGRAKGRVLRRLLDRHKPTRAIELGSLLGYSAILIAGSMPPKGRLLCIEANPFLAYLVRANAAEAGLARRFAAQQRLKYVTRNSGKGDSGKDGGMRKPHGGISD